MKLRVNDKEINVDDSLSEKNLLDFSLALVCHIVSLVIEGSIAHNSRIMYRLNLFQMRQRQNRDIYRLTALS